MVPAPLKIAALATCAKRSMRQLLLCGLLAAPLPAFPAQGSTPIDPAIMSAVFAVGASHTEQQELRAIYEGTGGRLLWTTPERRFALVKMLVDLEVDGINLARLGALPGTRRSSSAQDDVFATRAVLRAAYLMAGRSIEAGSIVGWNIAPPMRDIVASFIVAAQEDKLGAILRDLRPTAVGYQQLQSAYMRYRSLAQAPWPNIDVSGPRIAENDDKRVPEVVRRLILLGDIAEVDPAPATIEAGIRRFQMRHGLDPDGRAGPATLEQLNVSPQARATQIAVNLQFWRLLPQIWPKRFVAVNTAAAHLDVMLDGQPQFSTRVIVGDPDHPTPIISSRISAVTLNPSWTIPRSIATKEILPRIRRDHSYLAKNNIEIADRADDPNGLDVDWRRYSRSNFPFRLRQIPGPGNALGLVKFEMPNPFDVYLHDTPDRTLFDKSSRALSHGCVRVQGPRELAEHLIADPEVWLSNGLLGALQEGRTYRVPLKQGIPVYLLYFTSFVGVDGDIQFRPDIYGREASVRRALSRPSP